MGINRTSRGSEAEGPATACGLLILRLSGSFLLVYLHGGHKLEGFIAFLAHGTPWSLVGEVTEMRIPMPLLASVIAMLVEVVCSLFLIAGLFVRVNALLLTGMLSVAILQNVQTHHDPQLAALYLTVMLSMVFTGGGRFSMDAWGRRRKATSNPSGIEQEND